MSGELSVQDESFDFGSHDERVVSGGLIANGLPRQIQQLNRIISGKYRGEILTSLPQSTRQDKLNLYNATAAVGNALPDMAKGNPVEVQHIVLSHAEFPDEDGNIKPGAKLVLISPRGDKFVVLSQTFIKAFGDIITMFSPLPFDPPLFVSAVQTDMKGGRRYYLPKLHE